MVNLAEEINEQLALLQMLFAHSPVGFAFVDQSFRFVQANDSFPIDQPIGKTVEELCPHLWPVLEPNYRRALAGESIQNCDVSCNGFSDDGRVRHWLQSFYPIRVHDEVVGVGVIVNEVTARREAEETLRVCSDLYAMIARTNRAVSRCQTVEDLYQELCEIAVDTGRFQFAWVGVCAEDRLNLVACAGDDLGYASGLFIPMDDNDPRSLGPTGRAVKSGKAVVVNDFLASTLTAPWHEKAGKAGFASSAAFPIKQRDQVVAVLSMYATSPGFFTDELVETLSEITPSVSFAIDRFAMERERVAAEAESQASRQQLISILESIGDCFFTLDSKWRFVYLNPKSEVTLNRPRAELLGRNLWEAFPDAVGGPFERECRYAIVEQVPVAFEMYYPPVERWFSIHIYPSPDGLSVYLSDVTDRRRAEETNALLAAIVASSDDAIIGENLEQVVTSWNAAAERLFGYPAKEAIGKRIEPLIIPEDRQGEESEILTKMAQGIPVDHFETVRRRKDGSLFDIALTVSPTRDSVGRIVGFSRISHDVSERKRAEKAQEEAAQRFEVISRQLLRAQEAERHRIASQLHDEIGQSLTALKINLQEINNGRGIGIARLQESLDIVNLTMEQVAGLALDLRPSMLDDLGLISALNWYVERQARRTGLNGNFVSDPDNISVDPEVEVACFRIVQEALTNVARHAKATRFIVELVQHSSGLSLVIRDDGVGFDPKVQLRSSARGSSFGLLGMQERVALIGGRIEFVSEPDGGTEVQVDFPSQARAPLKPL